MDQTGPQVTTIHVAARRLVTKVSNMATYNAAVIWLCFAVFFGALILIVNFISRLRKGKKKKTGRSESTEVIRDDNDRAVRNRGRGARGRMIARRDEEDDDGFYEDEDEEDFGMSEKLPKMGAKKRLKMEMKAEKRAMREEMEAEREERKQREAAREAERKREEKRREAEQQIQEEEERLRKEEQERREHEEYLKLKEMFSIDEEGTGETEEESQALLQEFVDYIKTSKVVLLEDLACHFGLRTQDAINRLQNLQEMGRVTGVTDDRGKFIYISEEELASVARFIMQRGRVTITELAECSNSLINLKPSVIDKSRQMEISA